MSHVFEDLREGLKIEIDTNLCIWAKTLWKPVDLIYQEGKEEPSWSRSQNGIRF